MIKKLIEKIKLYNPSVDEDLINRAFFFADEYHKNQKRNSGEEYIIHPFNVALILAEMNMDTQTIIAGLLHDTVEDTPATYDQIKTLFGEEIANLVEGVTKLTQITFKSKEEKQAENIRKMVLAMSKDIRVIIVKLADRLHNMRTLEYMMPEKKKEKARETLEIYAPIADRLGMSKVKWELEDLALRYLDSEYYHKLTEMVNKRRNERESLINNIIGSLKENINKVNIKAEISGRPKNFYSIYKKMEIKGKIFDEIYDLSAIRILVKDVKDCYGVLGVVHTLWKPIPGRFKDYIAMPKPNNYQSIHTTVIDNKGETFEVQIRTYEMHQTAEYGIAAHWKYKSGKNKNSELDENLTWLRQLMEWQKDLKDPEDFMETLKIDFFADEVFVFTPNGDVINLPEGSTPIDFAYRIHSDIGNTCIGAKINGRIVPLNYKLKSGNIVNIIRNLNSKPSLDWLSIVKSPQAKKKINQYFKIKEKDRNIDLGMDLIEREIKRLGYKVNDLLRDEWLDEIREKLKVSNLDIIYAAIGFGTMNVNQVVTKLVEFYKKENKKEEPVIETKKTKDVDKGGIIIKGIDNLKVRFSKCCNPVPGDEIIGYVTFGRGISVHRKDCTNIVHLKDDARLIEVNWNNDQAVGYNTRIEIIAIDKFNVIPDVTTKIKDCKLELLALNATISKDKDLIVDVTIAIHSIEELVRLIEKLKNIKNVLSVYRLKY